MMGSVGVWGLRFLLAFGLQLTKDANVYLPAFSV